MPHRSILPFIILGGALSIHVALADDVVRTPLPSEHPLVGTWRIDLESVQCHETDDLRADGTTRVSSAEEISESEFEISLSPSPQGFYKWVDKIIKDNGKPDCPGSVTEIGHVATNYVILDPSGKMFLLCTTEELKRCIGPFVRQEGI
jgi:hypothetical protein